MKTARHATREWGGILVVGLLLLAPVGCSDWLNVPTPDIISSGAVNNSDGAIARYNGALGAFAFGNDGDNGGTEGQVLVSGVMSDEYIDAETFPTRIEYDSRSINTITNNTLPAVFFNISQARVAAEHAAAALENFAPTPDSRIGEMQAVAGLIYTEIAENYCSGVPFDERNDDGSLSYGTPQTTQQILDRAILRYDSALAHSTATDSLAKVVHNFAKVGIGRALLDEGNFAGAAAAVAGVPTGFRYQTAHSTSTGREFNGVYWFNGQAPNGTQRFSVADQEGTVGLNFRTAGDPRVSAPQNGLGFDNATPLYVLTKYTSPTQGVVVSSGVEARLIEAEAALAVPDTATAMADLNALRADAGHNGGFALAALPNPGSDTGVVTLLFRERAFWMFATGHRLGDLRRLMRQYGRAENAVYPNGTYFKGSPATYGNNTELPMPFSETNNPNFTLAACNNNVP